MLVLSDASIEFSIASFAIVIGASVGRANARVSLVFLFSNGILKKFLKIMTKKEANTKKMFY